jgi:hypothetical protein
MTKMCKEFYLPGNRRGEAGECCVGCKKRKKMKKRACRTTYERVLKPKIRRMFDMNIGRIRNSFTDIA